MLIEEITPLLAKILDPITGLNLFQLNLHPVLSRESHPWQLTLSAGFPTAHLEQHFAPLLKKALEEAYPHQPIALHFVSLIKAHRTQMPGKGLRGVKNVIAIASGKGGVGKSTIAAHLAVALGQLGARVGLLDADIYGPSVPTLLGPSNPIQMDNGHYLPILAHGIQAMSIGYLIAVDAPLIWRGPMLAKSLLQLLDKTAWDELDYLIIDLPPGTGDIQLSLVQKIPLTTAIVVTTPQIMATIDAEKAIQMFDKTGIDTLGIIENMAYHQCSQCGHEATIFGEGGGQFLSEKYHKALLAHLPLNQQIRENGDKGSPVLEQDDSLFMSLALKVSSLLSTRPINYADKFPDVQVVSG